MTYKLEDGLRLAIASIELLRRRNTGQYTLVFVAGGSASGKTTQVARRIRDHFGATSRLISLDNYYLGTKRLSQLQTIKPEITWDDPEALDLSLAAEHARSLLDGQAIAQPIYDFRSGERISTTTITPAPVIIIEGIFALHPIFSSLPAYNIFVDIGLHGRIMRRLMRDVERTKLTASEIFDYCTAVVEPRHQAYVQTQAQRADVVISNEYQPYLEAWQRCLHRRQWKYFGQPSVKELDALGAQWLGTVHHIDIYYTPKDRDLLVTDEAMRLRREVVAPDVLPQYILTYKGPRRPDRPHQRPVIEFALMPQCAERFTMIYGHPSKRVEKYRQLFAVPHGIICLDEILKYPRREQRSELFTEFRLTGQEASLDEFQKTIIKLGFKPSDPLPLSYLEM